MAQTDLSYGEERDNLLFKFFFSNISRHFFFDVDTRQLSNKPKTMKTRSHHTTAAVANAAAAVGLKVTSTQPIRGRKNSISATDVLTRQVKQKTARINEKTAIVEQKTNAMKQQIELTNDRITKARRKLDVLFNEEAVQELVKQGMNISVDKDGNVTGVTMPVLKRAVPLYDALGLPKVGASRTQVGKTNQKTLPPTHAVATKMQKLTGSTLTAKDIQNMEFMAQYHGTEMEHGGFKTNGEQIRNNHGKMVDKNWHIYGKETYKAQKEKGTGLAKHHAEKCLNLIHTIPETVARYSSICAMLTDEEGRGVGFDFRQLPDNYQG